MIESISSKSTKDDVALFFSKLCNFGDDIKNNLIKNDISGDILLDLKNSDYKNLGLKLGQIKKITNYLEENKEKFTQNEIKEVISKESSPEDVSKFFESFLNIKENINTLDGKKLLELNVDEIEELGLGLNYVKKKKLLKYIEYFKTLEMEPPESISEIVITKESKKEDVAKFLKIKLGFSEKSIEFLGLDGRGLFSLKENDIQKEEHLTQEEKEKILNFLIRNKKEYKDSDIKLTKESTNEEVTNFLKIKLGFSEQIIESLRLDGNSLFSLKEEEIKNKNNNLNQEEKDKLITFLKEIRKKEEEKKSLK